MSPWLTCLRKNCIITICRLPCQLVIGGTIWSSPEMVKISRKNPIRSDSGCPYLMLSWVMPGYPECYHPNFPLGFYQKNHPTRAWGHPHRHGTPQRPLSSSWVLALLRSLEPRRSDAALEDPSKSTWLRTPSCYRLMARARPVIRFCKYWFMECIIPFIAMLQAFVIGKFENSTDFTMTT